MNPKLYFTRNMIRYFISVLAITMVMAGPSYACCSAGEAHSALQNGQFDYAVDIASQVKTNEARLIAAKALNAKVLLGLAEDDKKTAKDALALAQAVLEGDPDNAEARFQYALADGFITRAASPLSAWRKKLPQKTKVVVDSLIESAPNDGRGYALLGAWHMGVLRKAGEKNGKKWFGADPTQGQAAYETALTLRPGDIIITSNYALSLADLDFDANGPRAREMLVDVLMATPKDGLERDVQSRMRGVLNLWDNEKSREDRIGLFLDGKG